MQEVVDSIIAAEQEARKRISEAAKQADLVRVKADADSSDLIFQAKESAAAELRRRVDSARSHAEVEYLEARKKAEKTADALYASMEPLVAELAEKAALLAMTTELER